MPEPYAVRVGPDGKKTYYKTKKDYDAGVHSSHMRTAKRIKNIGS